MEPGSVDFVRMVEADRARATNASSEAGEEERRRQERAAKELRMRQALLLLDQ